MPVITWPEYGQIEISDSEGQLVDLVTGYLEQTAVLGALKKFCNADKVIEVLKLRGQLKIKHASYTLYPIISQIGERSPEQYVADVDKAVREFNEQYLTDHPEIAKFYRKERAANHAVRCLQNRT